MFVEVIAVRFSDSDRRKKNTPSAGNLEINQHVNLLYISNAGESIITIKKPMAMKI